MTDCGKFKHPVFRHRTFKSELFLEFKAKIVLAKINEFNEEITTECNMPRDEYGMFKPICTKTKSTHYKVTKILKDSINSVKCTAAIERPAAEDHPQDLQESLVEDNKRKRKPRIDFFQKK